MAAAGRGAPGRVDRESKDVASRLPPFASLRGQVHKSGLSGSTSDTTKWILAASSPEESHAWIDALKQAGVSTAYFSTDVLKSPGGRLSLMPRRNSDVAAATAPTSERRGSGEDGRTRAISCPPRSNVR